MAIERIYDSAAAFGNALDKLADQMGDEMDKGVRKTAIDLTSKIVKDTPVDTGRARASWLLTSDKPSEEVKPPGNYPEPTIEDPGPAVTWEWWLVNNLEYIEPLEDGHSDQAPQGMVAQGMNAFADHLSRNLRGMETIE